MANITALYKFEHCFELHKKLVNVSTENKSFYIEKGINVSAFEKLMLKCDLEEYTYILLAYFIEFYFRPIDEEMLKFKRIKHKEKIACKKNELEMTKLLYFMLSNTNDKLTSISFYRSMSSFSTTDSIITKAIISNLISTYNNSDYNKFFVAFKDDIEINMPSDMCSKAQRTSFDEYVYRFLPEISNIESTTPDILNHYLHFLKTKLDVITKATSKRGAKSKNMLLSWLCENLAYLVRLNTYLNRPDIKYIDDISLTNKDCRLIHDILVFFNIIEDKSNTLTKSLPEKYIRTLLKQRRLDNFDTEYIKVQNNIIFELKNEYNLI